MQVSGIGGGAAMGGAMGLGGPAMLGGGAQSAAATSETLGAACADGSGYGDGALQKIGTAQFLFALLILAALEKDDEGKGSNAAMGFLAGLMMAGAFQQLGGAGFDGMTQGLAVGGALDVMA
ncbi:MAG: hypothetical protein WED34_16745 [Planctomycetales bacterium]